MLQILHGSTYNVYPHVGTKLNYCTIKLRVLYPFPKHHIVVVMTDKVIICPVALNIDTILVANELTLVFLS